MIQFSQFERNQMRAIRSFLRMSQTELAERSGVEYTAVNGIESGRINPTETQIERIKQALAWDDTLCELVGQTPCDCQQERAS